MVCRCGKISISLVLGATRENIGWAEPPATPSGLQSLVHSPRSYDMMIRLMGQDAGGLGDTVLHASSPISTGVCCGCQAPRRLWAECSPQGSDSCCDQHGPGNPGNTAGAYRAMGSPLMALMLCMMLALETLCQAVVALLAQAPIPKNCVVDGVCYS